MQVMNFLEDGNSVSLFNSSFIPQASASSTSDYSKRYPSTLGDSLGILLGNSGGSLNQPVQELLSVSFTGVDVLSSTGGIYNAYVSRTETLSGTGLVFISLLSNFDSSVGTYPGCDTKDIKLPNGQVWAACNVGATKAYKNEVITHCSASATGGSVTDCDISLRSTIGSYYQWGRNDDVTLQGTPTTTLAPGGVLAGGVGHSNFIINTAYPYDWIATQNDNIWGGAGTTTTTGTYISQGSPSAMQGPCSAGYHVPTQFEWCSVVQSINPALTCTWTWQDDTSFATILRLPLSGNRTALDGY
jgi:hypothetical protein